MFLAIDIGNSLIKFGIYEGSTLVNKLTIATKLDYTAEELAFDRFHVLEDEFIQLKFDSVYVASVVPGLNWVIAELCLRLFKLSPVFVHPGFDLGLKLNYGPLVSLGPDRLVSCFCAVEKYGPPVIVCSFGTATTIDVVTKEREFIGGIIAPGMGTMTDSLNRRAANLPAVRIAKPEHIIGDSTESAIAAGVFHGHIAMTEGLIARIRAAVADDDIKVIATGGFASLIAPETDVFDTIDENLILDGLRLIAARD